MAIEVSSSISQIDPSQIFSDGFELSTQSIIPSQDYSGSFIQGLNNIEFYIYNAAGQIQSSDYNHTHYTITTNSNPLAPGTNEINIFPEEDVYNGGYTNGKLTAVYNFVNHELSSSIENPYYLAEISSDRTEVRLKSNFISNEEILTSFTTFNSTLQTAEFFDEFYISFGNNENHIGINTQIDIPEESTSGDQVQYSILIKLYDALPPLYTVGNELYVITKTGETQAFQIEFEETIIIPDDTIKLRGPNTNLDVKDFVNNSSTYKSKEELINTQSSSSKDELLNVLNREGIHLTPNYSSASFNEFVNFSSAQSRVNNFYTKVKNIQTYENDIRLISATTGSNSTSVSSSISTLWDKIEDEIKNFDGYEYYQYYNTSSDAYPKNTSGTGVTYPYELLDYDSVQVLTWLGSNNPNSQYYGGMNFSSSFYDENNENWLYYSIPSFITEQNDNDNYVEFCNMVGQSFDELWLYTKTITEKLNTTNQLDKGVPLSLADDVITSLGYTGFGNNYNNQDNFIGLVGNDNGSYVPPTGSELINHYIAINQGTITNYWDVDYSWQGYVEQLISAGFPYPIDAVSKEIFKRLYHNMSYLVKKKGTIAGLRQLITIWGIPSTILRINEFGGKNKDQTDDYDLWYQRYSYAFTPVGNSYRASASAVIPWMPLERNYIAENEEIVPDGVGFRFKTTGFPSSSYAGSYDSQSLAVKKSDGVDDTECDWGIALFYTGSTSGSYSGSSNSNYFDYGELRFFISGSSLEGGTVVSDPVYLPFFDKGWWTVLLQKDVHSNDITETSTYTLYVKNKLYDGADGNSIGFTGSTTISVNGTDSSSINEAWGHYGSSSYDGVTLGGRLNGSKVGTALLNENSTTNDAGFGFSGSFQEFRYYSNAISESVFNDTVMNPESIEGNRITGSESSFDIVNFRAPLGNELENIFTSSQLTKYNVNISSSHPAVTASAIQYITGSFYNPIDTSYTSSYKVWYEANTVKRTYSKTNVETYFLDQPAIGVRNRVTNKISSTSNLNFGTALSNVVSIQKDPFISQSYTENINTLEVAFSPQDEINDDIIASLGYGAIQEAIADPRFRSQSADTYPVLDNIAKDYFRKYVGSDVFDYLRLIKYFDDSLFRAIKNYVPARTSVSTGIIIKQNMLERNRYREPQVDSYTTQSYAITNIPLPQQNLELTGSIDAPTIEGGAGGSVNEYNTLSSQSGYFIAFDDTAALFTLPANTTKNMMDNTITQTRNFDNGDFFGEVNNSFGVAGTYLKVKNPIQAQISLYALASTTGPFNLIISSSERGELFRSPSLSSNSPSSTTSLIQFIPGESIGYFIHNGPGSTIIGDFYFKSNDPTTPQATDNSLAGDISSSIFPSHQAYLENNITTLGLIPEVNSFQEEFYDGEYSGSAVNALVTQSNPYKSVPPSSTIISPQPITNTNNATPATFITPLAGFTGFSFDTTGEVGNTNYIFNVTDTKIIPGQTYEIFCNVTINSGAGGIGFIPYNYDAGPPDPTTISSPTTANGAPQNNIDTSGNLSFTFTFTAPPSTPPWQVGNTLYSFGFMILGELVGSVDNIAVTGVGGMYNNQVQAFIPWDLNVINNYNILTSGSFNISNTQSLIFENSDYNPLNNNVEYIRRSTNHYQLEYTSSGTPSNLESIIGVMYNPLSSSAKATVPDSNYTQLSTLNPTYRGSKIQSLDYNNYTPSGSVRPINSLPPKPNNTSLANVSSSVADSFLDGSTGSWGGDNVDNRLIAAIDKNPQYIAHFERSFEQLNYYNSREFKIDSLISISMDNLSGQEITPISIDIDGRNLYKKWVSSVFEPNREVGISYTTQDSTKTTAVYLETTNNTSYDLLGGNIQFLTLNANAKSRNASSNAYFYTRGDSNIAEIALTGSLTGSTNQATAGGGIIQSGSTMSQGTLGLPILQTSLNGVGGTVYPIVQDGIAVNVLFSSSVTAGGTEFARNYQEGEEIVLPRTYLVAQGYLNASSNITIVLPEINIQNTKTTQLNQDLNAIQMVTASQVTGDGQQFGFLLSGSATTSSVDNGTNFLLPFSQDQEKSGFTGLPNASKLSIGGPQLALFHSYNQLVASQSIRPALTCPSPSNTYISQSPVWVLEGIDPASQESYYEWAPSSSDCPFYEDNKRAYLIERGDVLRVEGIKSLNISATVTSSIEFIEEFTVTEVQNFNYSSSAVADQPGTLIANSSPIIIAPLVDISSKGGKGYIMTDLVSGPTPPTALNFTFSTDSATGTGGTVYLQVNQSGPSDTGEYWISADGVYIQSGVGSSGYVPGDTITISAADLNLEFNNLNVNDDLVITLNSAMVAGGIGNNFTVLTDLDPGCLNPNSSPPDDPYGQGYIQYDIGDIGLILPTFLKTDRNPSVVLEGLQGGAITKFTLIRQIENEQKVMIKNTPATKNSQGFLSQTGGGFLIPDDLSSTQKLNALNIINQLRQKNAFPGDSATSFTSNLE